MGRGFRYYDVGIWYVVAAHKDTARQLVVSGLPLYVIFAFIWMLDYNSRYWYCGLSTFGIPKISNAGLCESSEHEINNRAKPEKKKVNLSNLKGF